MDKHFKILRISHIFASAQLGQIMSGIKGFKDLPFRGQIASLADLKIDNCESLSRELRARGHQVEDVYFDLEVSQKKWAEENDVYLEPRNWEDQILLSQIEKIRPDILFFQKATQLPKSVLVKLKVNYPFLRKIVLHTAYLGNISDPGYVDLLLVGTPSLVDRFQRQGFQPQLFYHYFDPQILQLVKFSCGLNPLPLTFLGSSGFGGGYLHADRFETLRFLMENTSIEMWLNEPVTVNKIESWREKTRKLAKLGFRKFPNPILSFFSRTGVLPKPVSDLANECMREREFHLNGRELPTRPLQSIFPARCHDAMMGIDYYKVMARSEISFTKACNNIYDGNSNNKGDIGALRLFEATGLGSCLVADTGPNMSDLFEEGKEIVTYTCQEEALEKIQYLLSNNKERKKIAAAGQVRTLRDHTAAERAKQFDYLLRESFN